MAIFASTTTSGYSDPMKAMTIKALEKRQADIMAQNAQAGAITPENTQTPIQGVGHIVNQLAGQMNEGRAMAAVAAQREQLSRNIAGIKDPMNPTMPEIAGLSADPELMKQMLTQLAENRRQAAQQAHETSRDTSRYEFEGGQRGEDRKVTVAGQEQTATLQREKIAADRAEGGETRQLTRDMATQDQLARADLAKAERDFKAAESNKELAFRGTDRQAQINAEMALDKARGVREQALANLNNAAGQKVAETQVAGSAANTAATNASRERVAADERASVERVAATNAAAKAAELAGDPQRAQAVVQLGTAYARQTQAVDKLDKAVSILQNGGINTGPWARAETAAAMLADGRFGTDKEMAQRTTDFNSLVNESTIQHMAETLKGQTTNFEMEKFIEVMNNPNSSPEARVEAIIRLRDAAKVGRDLSAEAFKKSGGNIDLIHQHLGRPTPAANADPLAGTAAAASKTPAASGTPAAADPLEGKIADGPNGPIIRRNGAWVKHGG